MKLKFALAAAALALSAAGAHAATVLSDNFNSDTYTGPYGMNYAGDAVFSSFSPSGNSPAAASVDLVGTGTEFPFPGAGTGYGLFIDLDGSTGSGNQPVAGALISNAVLGAGEYTLSFDLAGNQRGAAAQTTYAGVYNGSTGTLVDSLTPLNTQAFTTYTVSFYTTGGNLVIGDEGPSDQQGNLLDNVTLTSAAPEPAGWALMIAGVGLIGLTFRHGRRETAARAA